MVPRVIHTPFGTYQLNLGRIVERPTLRCKLLYHYSATQGQLNLFITFHDNPTRFAGYVVPSSVHNRSWLQPGFERPLVYTVTGLLIDFLSDWFNLDSKSKLPFEESFAITVVGRASKVASFRWKTKYYTPHACFAGYALKINPVFISRTWVPQII